MRLQNKHALVTGGSEGIGKAVAKAFIDNGAKVIIVGRDEKKLISARKDISSSENFSYIPGDISKPDDVEKIRKFVEQEFLKLDILVNNASVLGPRTGLLNYPDDDWKKVIDININGQFFITKALIPLLKKSKNGSIINVSSGVGRIGKANWGAYSVSKFGLEALSQILADELKEFKIRSNAVNPGATRTKMRANAYPDEDPLTLPTPEHITPVFLYLASDESIEVTGKSFEARDWMIEE